MESILLLATEAQIYMQILYATLGNVHQLLKYCTTGDLSASLQCREATCLFRKQAACITYRQRAFVGWVYSRFTAASTAANKFHDAKVLRFLFMLYWCW